MSCQGRQKIVLFPLGLLTLLYPGYVFTEPLAFPNPGLSTRPEIILYRMRISEEDSPRRVHFDWINREPLLRLACGTPHARTQLDLPQG